MKKYLKATALVVMACFACTSVFAAKAKKRKANSKEAASPEYQYEKDGWKSAKIVGGGMIPGIIFNTTKKGVAYVRTDMGGAYRWLPESESWKPLTDFAGVEDYGRLGIASLATDPVEPNRLVIASGTYTNDWDPTPAEMLVSEDYGDSFVHVKMYKSDGTAMKFGGNMPGRGCGERLAIDPNNNKIIYFGSFGDGLWRSRDYGHTWEEVKSFPAKGNVYDDDFAKWNKFEHYFGILWVMFDPASGTAGGGSKNIYVGVADTSDTIFESNDAGATWHPLAGAQDIGEDMVGDSSEYSKKYSTYPKNYQEGRAALRKQKKHAHATGDVCSCEKYYPITATYSPKGEMIVAYNAGFGPYTSSRWGGAIWKYNFAKKEWKDISLPKHDADPSAVTRDRGAGSVAVDWQNPDTLIAVTLNEWWPDEIIYRSTDGGEKWNPIWTFGNYPERINKYTLNIKDSPWLDFGEQKELPEQSPKLGWCIADIEIDPFDSNTMMYGTGATLYGTHNLTDWDKGKKVNIKVMAAGIEECAILDLISPPKGVHLISGMGDIGGFVHHDLKKADNMITNPWISGVSCLDYAEDDPFFIIRMGDGKFMYSEDGGERWTGAQSYIDGANTGWGGTAAVSAKASSIVWAPSNLVAHWSTDLGKKWTQCKGLPAGAKVVSDRKNDKKFYAYGDGNFYASEDGGKTFSMVNSTWNAAKKEVSASDLGAALIEGHIWFAAGKAGLWHSEDGGKTWTETSGFDDAMIIGFGKGKDGSGYQALYTNSKIRGKYGIYRSDDKGATWVRINDDNNPFGAANSTITGDPRIDGRVYIGANGRGILYRDLE